jgi:hypothetical protein
VLPKIRRAASKLAQVAYATVGCSDAQLIELGLLPRAVRRPRVLPAEAPVGEVVSVRGRVVNVRIYARSEDEGRKPLAALGAEIYTHVGEESPSDPRAYRLPGHRDAGDD